MIINDLNWDMKPLEFWKQRDRRTLLVDSLMLRMGEALCRTEREMHRKNTKIQHNSHAKAKDNTDAEAKGLVETR